MLLRLLNPPFSLLGQLLHLTLDSLPELLNPLSSLLGQRLPLPLAYTLTGPDRGTGTGPDRTDL